MRLRAFDHAAVSISLIAGAALLSACGGGGNTTPPATSASSAPQPAGKTKVTFVIDAPKSTTSAKSRSTQYISPATTQMLVNIEQNSTSVGSYPVTVALNPTSAGCMSTLANTTCQLSVLLNTGAYTATLTAEDSGGHALSSAQNIAFTVTTIPVTVPLTLSGVPASIHVASGAYALHGAGTSGFTLYGTAAQPVIVTALDADGNTIVGPGAPTYTATLASGTGWSATTPASATPNTISITPPGTNGSGATFAVTANYNDGGATCALSGAVCTTSFTVANDIPTLLVSNSSSNTVTAYRMPYTAAPTSVAVGYNPIAVALDHAGNLFVGAADDSIREFAPPYSGSATAVINAPYNPDWIILDSSGNLYSVAEDHLTIFTPPYTGTPTDVGNTIYEPEQLAFDPSGNLYILNYAASITEYALPYSAITSTITNGLSGPQAMVFDPAGDLFVADFGSGVLRYPATSSTPTTILDASDAPRGLVLDGAGNLFVETYNSIVEFAPPYSTPTLTITTPGNNVSRGIAIDGAGNLLLVTGGNEIVEYAPPYTGAPTVITSGLSGPNALVVTP